MKIYKYFIRKQSIYADDKLAGKSEFYHVMFFFKTKTQKQVIEVAVKEIYFIVHSIKFSYIYNSQNVLM